MPTYIILYKLTDQGIRNIKEAPQRIEEGTKALERSGGRQSDRLLFSDGRI
jgi:uncharacterized protein with GYD domain